MVAARQVLPIPGAAGVTLATLGAALGVSYATSNHLEIAVGAVYRVPVGCTAAIVDARGVVVGSASATVSGWGAEAGVRYLSGLTWRLRLAASLGWSHAAFSKVELTGASTPATAAGTDALVAAAAAGVVWQFDDHLSVSAAARLEVLLGGAARLGFAVPVAVAYSWYLP